MVAIERVSRRFGSLLALDDVSVDVGMGELLSLLGPSGSGKSTLLRIVAGVERPTTGRVTIAGAVVVHDTVFVEPETRQVGMVFQDYALFPHLTVAANVAFGLSRRPASERDRIVGSMLERVGLSRYASKYPHMLSGGERQRVALARALAPAPRVLLMDEPFSGLDGRLRDEVRRETLTLLRESKTTTVVVTHDPLEAIGMGGRIALLRGGRLLQCGSPEELYAAPVSAFAARFFGDVNELAGTCRDGHVHTAMGTFPAPPHLAGQATARVCIRPQHIHTTSPGRGVRGRVLSAEFLGDADRVLVVVDGVPAPVHMRTAAGMHLAPEAIVYLEVEPAAAMVLADESR
jgi:iron(III) transport system ATP-binding protein